MSTLTEQMSGPYRRFIILGIAMLSALGAIYWQLQAWEKNKAQLSELLNTITTAEHNLTFGKNLSADLKSLQELEAKIKPSILDISKKATNIGLFYNLESTTAVHIEGVTQDTIKETLKQGDQTYSIIPFILTATGSFESIEIFLNALHALPIFLRINQFSLEQMDPKTKGKDIHNIRLTLRFGALGI